MDLSPVLLVEIGVVLGIKPAPAMTIPSGHGSYIGQDRPRIMARSAESPPTPTTPLNPRSQMDLPRLRLTLLALPLAVACASNEASTTEPVATETKASVEAQQLDPNDPNVEVCPVTGAMQLKSDAGSSPH